MGPGRPCPSHTYPDLSRQARSATITRSLLRSLLRASKGTWWGQGRAAAPLDTSPTALPRDPPCAAQEQRW